MHVYRTFLMFEQLQKILLFFIIVILKFASRKSLYVSEPYICVYYYFQASSQTDIMLQSAHVCLTRILYWRPALCCDSEQSGCNTHHRLRQIKSTLSHCSHQSGPHGQRFNTFHIWKQDYVCVCLQPHRIKSNETHWGIMFPFLLFFHPPFPFPSEEKQHQLYYSKETRCNTVSHALMSVFLHISMTLSYFVPLSFSTKASFMPVLLQHLIH